jgi:hypothetical protein
MLRRFCINALDPIAILKNSRGKFKGNAMLSYIALSFDGVPLEFHTPILALQL